MKTKKNQTKKFAGANADYKTIFGKMDIWLLKVLIPRIPLWLETNHFTLLSIPLVIANVAIGFLAQSNILFSLLLVITISLNHVFDLLDGALGRHRNTGLVLWGFYMDKIVDFGIIASLCLSIAIAFSELYLLAFSIFIMLSGMYYHSALYFGASGTLQKNYHYFGFTELKFAAICIAVATAFGGKEILQIALLLLLLGSSMALGFIIFKSQQLLWIKDLENKKRVVN